jgi:hypothetical protein
MVLPNYRVEVFRQMAMRLGIDLTVVYAGEPDLPSVGPDGFSAHRAPMWRGRLGRHPIYWHGAQVGYATRSITDVQPPLPGSLTQPHLESNCLIS